MTDIEHNNWKILVGDCRERLEGLPDESVHMIWTSPPYFGLRDYGEKDQIGLELTPEYSRNTKAPWEDGYIPKEIEEDSVIEEMSFDDLLG
jgi:DNA modification methylase